MIVTDSEETKIYSDSAEATQIADISTPSEKNTEISDKETSAATAEENKGNHKKAKTIGGIAAGGVLLGSAASVVMDMKGASSADRHEIDEEQDESDLVEEGVLLPEITVEALSMQKEDTVKEWMTFDEAFSAARDERGPGSVFEWHGNVYATYTQEEWTDMTDDQKSDFYDTVHIHNPFSTVDNSEVRVEDAVLTAEAVFSNSSGANIGEGIMAQTVVQPVEDNYGEDIPIVSVGSSFDNENDIQILGVSQDVSTGYNVGHLSVDGEEVVVVDVDGDMVFDSMVVDVNNDGEITPDEIIDIRQHSLTLDGLSGHSEILINPLDSSGDSPDYLSEIVQ